MKTLPRIEYNPRENFEKEKCNNCLGYHENRCTSANKEPYDCYREFLESQNKQLLEALEQAVNVIKLWHGDEVFDIYYNRSPEMKLIREAIVL